MTLALLACLSTAHASEVDFLGWADVMAHHDSRDSEPDYLDMAHVYLILHAQLDSQWSFFGEVELEHSPHMQADGSRGELMLERGYIERAGPRLRLRAGKFNTPYGLRLPTHWLILTPVLAKPIYEDNGYVPAKSVGVELRGAVEPGLWELSATAFLSNGVEVHGTNHPLDGMSGVGGDLSASYLSAYRFGVSGYRQLQPEAGGREELSVVTYMEGYMPLNLLLRAEFTAHVFGAQPTLRTWYVVGSYSVHGAEHLAVTYRFGRGQDQRRADGGLHSVHTVNLSYQITDRVRVAAEENLHRIEGGASYQGTSLWLGASF